MSKFEPQNLLFDDYLCHMCIESHCKINSLNLKKIINYDFTLSIPGLIKKIKIAVE